MKTNNTPLTVAGAATGDLSASFNSDPYRVENFVWASITATVSGSSALNGALKLQACNDLGYTSDGSQAGATGLTNWVDVTGSTLAITADGSQMWNESNIGFRWFRVVYTRTAGSGSLAIRVNAKGAV